MVTRWRASYDTQRPDELSLDQLFPSSASTPLGLVASSAPLSSSELRPIPSDKCVEVPLRSALRRSPVASLVDATAREIDKQRGFGALGRDIDEASLPAGAIVVDAHVLYKHKHDGRDTCRIAAMGDRLPPKPSEETFASVVSDGAKYFAVAAMQAHCKSRGEDLLISDADVVGGFLHIPLDSPVPMFLRLPNNLPHPLAGRLLEIHHAIYGLRESNRLFNIEMSRVIMEDAGFVVSADPQQFVAFESDPGRRCVVSVTVDDLLILSNSVSLRQRLLDALQSRFGALTVNLSTSMHAGVEFSRTAEGGVRLSQNKAIARAASVVGVSHMPPVLVPARSDFFDVQFSEAEAASVPSDVYSSLTGKLVQFLKTRHEIRHLVSHLCSFNQSPLEGHYRRAIHVLRYLASTPSLGCVFDASEVELVSFSDAAYHVFRDGFSSTANIFSIGVLNAPFAVTAHCQTDMAPCPATAEYYAAGEAAKALVFYRRLASSLGWCPRSATRLFVDSKTTVSLTQSPAVSSKMRHVEQRHHYIRHLHGKSVVQLVYIPGSQMRANVLTKVLPRGLYLQERSRLLNTGADSLGVPSGAAAA
jgi:hypothetical protein